MLTQTKPLFVQWIISSFPNVDKYLGFDKLNQWASGTIFSKQYDNWFSRWKNNDPNLKNSLMMYLTGLNPAYASYMDQALNSGNFQRGLIAQIQKGVTQTQQTLTMWKNILAVTTNGTMKSHAELLVSAYTLQLSQMTNTLSQYQKALADGLANGSLV